MAQIDIHQNNLHRKRTELADLSRRRAQEVAKAADYKKRIVSAQKTLSSTKSSSIYRTKLSEISRCEKYCADIEKKIADFDKKIANKNKEIMEEEKRYSREKARLDKKNIENEKKQQKLAEQKMRDINNSIDRYEYEQRQIKLTIQEMQKIPKTITVLFLASNPSEVSQLQLGEEARDIQEKIRMSQHRDSVKFETRWAVRPSDIIQAINELNPTIIHFSGHGAESSGELVLQNPDGTVKLITREAISQTISTVSDQVRLVFFNTCFSFTQAEAVVNYIEAAIGMSDSIGDIAARVFATQFYSSLGFGLTLDLAFRQAKAALMLEGIPEELTPILCVKEGKDPKEIYLVQPEEE